MPAKVKLPIMDKETGQVLEIDAIVYLYGEGKKDKGFVKVFHAFVKDVVRDKELRQALDLLAYIMSEKLERNSLKFYLTAEEVVRNLKVSRRTFYRWLKTLTEKGYITRIATNYYAIKPYTIIVGKMANAELYRD
jgi:DNA-binding transcriptional ArsR family regulator